MTRTALATTGVLLLSTGLASAGALDRTGQPVDVLFQEGSYVELGYGFTRADVQGTFEANGARSGDVANDFSSVSLAFKSDLSDRLSMALIFDQPFGADVDYGDADATYPIAGSQATFETEGATLLFRYKLNDRFSFHGGGRYVRVSADLRLNTAIPGVGVQVYDGDFDSDSDTGFVIGGAYERPEIGLRAAITYSSETSFSHRTRYVTGVIPPGGDIPTDVQEGVTEYTLPQSVNLEFRTGIAADTAVFASVRWADWSETEIRVPGGDAGGPVDFNPVVRHDGDVWTYTLGVGRRFTDRFAGSAAVIYERGIASDFSFGVEGSGASNLSPTDGQLGLQLSASYQVTDRFELSGGVRYARLGDATTRGFGARFEGNDAVSVGIRAGYRF